MARFKFGIFFLIILNPALREKQDEEWSKTKIFDLQDRAIPLKITVNSAKREIISIEIDFDYIKKRENLESKNNINIDTNSNVIENYINNININNNVEEMAR
jgi:phage-related protein